MKGNEENILLLKIYFNLRFKNFEKAYRYEKKLINIMEGNHNYEQLGEINYLMGFTLKKLRKPYEEFFLKAKKCGIKKTPENFIKNI